MRYGVQFHCSSSLQEHDPVLFNSLCILTFGLAAQHAKRCDAFIGQLCGPPAKCTTSQHSRLRGLQEQDERATHWHMKTRHSMHTYLSLNLSYYNFQQTKLRLNDLLGAFTIVVVFVVLISNCLPSRLSCLFFLLFVFVLLDLLRCEHK